MRDNKLSKEELADFCHIQYIDNDRELKVIHEFGQDYDQNRVSLARYIGNSHRETIIHQIYWLSNESSPQMPSRWESAKILSLRYFISMLSLPIEHRGETNPVKTRSSPVKIFKKYLHFAVSFLSKTVYE